MKILTNILLTFAIFIVLNVANANEFPNKTITIVCNWSAGGGQDTVSRLIAKFASERAGVPVVVNNVTGAGGSAPKHVQQFISEGYLRWDSLGEFLALGVSLEHLSEKYNDKKCKILAESLDKATEKLLLENKSPSRKLGGIDNRGSHFYIAFYWSELLSKQKEDIELSNFFTRIFNYLTHNEKVINDELIETQFQEHNINGYYLTDVELTKAAMCPSKTLNKIYTEF